MEVGGSSNCYVGNPNCVTCFLDSLEVDCGHVAHLLDADAAKRCPDNDCGPHLQTVDVIGGNGHVVRSSSRWVLPGQAGWDGSLDGLYRISRDGPDVFVDIISGGRYRYALDHVWLHSQTTPQNSGGQLSACLRNALRQFFPSQSAQGKSYSPIDDARFKAGIPFPISLGEPQASTLGLFDIHYDPSQVTLDHGDFESLKTIVEVVSHTVQFLQVWAGLRPNMELLMKKGLDTTEYHAAMGQWQSNYLYYAAKGKKQNGDSYKNDVEKWAKNRTFDILSQVRGDSKLSAQVEKCGFSLNGEIKRPDY